MAVSQRTGQDHLDAFIFWKKQCTCLKKSPIGRRTISISYLPTQPITNKQLLNMLAGQTNCTYTVSTFNKQWLQFTDWWRDNPVCACADNTYLLIAWFTDVLNKLLRKTHIWEINFTPNNLGRLTSYAHDQKGKLLETVFEQLYCDTSTTESVLSKREISKIYSSLFDTRQTFGNSWYSVSDTHKYQKTTEINLSSQQT